VVDISTLLSIALFGFWVFCIIDVATTDKTAVRNLPKWAWLLIVVVLWALGGLGWWLLGRPHRTPSDAGSSGAREHYPVGRAPRSPSPRRSRQPADRPEDEAVIRARIEERDRQLARWAEEDRRKRDGRGVDSDS
jgi:hypothetical protein